jgi:hypothetical protein
MLVEASKALPKSRALGSLARQAIEQSRTQATATMEDAEKLKSGEAYAALIYLALAHRDDNALRKKALELLTDFPAGKPQLRRAGLLAVSLLGDSSPTDTGALAKMVEEGAQGSDLIALLALACHRAGGDVWQSFRAESEELLASQALPGHLVLLINHLSENRLPLAAN